MNAPIKTLAGVIENPDEFFGNEKAAIFEKLKGLMDTIQILQNHIWIAVWVRPEFRSLGAGKKLYMTDNTRAEDVYQGCAGLVIAMGPQAFVSDQNVQFDLKPQIGDWVFYKRQAAGMRFRHNDVDCFMLDEERPIKAILSRPDIVE